MGIFGFGKEEVNNSPKNDNEEIVKEVASEVASSVPEMEKKAAEPVVPEGMKVTDEEKSLIKTFRGLPNDSVSRRDFLRMAGIFAVGIAAGCAPQPVQDALSPTVDSIKPEDNEEKEEEMKDILLSNPIKLSTREFVRGAEGYPNAIVDRSMFAKKENGEPLFLRYSGSQFDEVTYLHYTGEKPPVVGEIAPLMYKVPEDIGNLEIDIVPYAISVKSDVKSINLNDGKNHYLVPIVISGNSSGIIDEQENGVYKSFEVKPDSVSGLTKGYLSFAVLTEIGNELVVEGVIQNNNRFFVNKENIPGEISSLINEN